MHHLLAVLSLATALVAPPRRQTTRLRAASLEKKGDDYIFEDIAKNLGKGDQDRLYQYQLELAERYGEDKIGRAAPPPKPKKPKQGAAVVDAAREAVVKAVTTPPAQRNSKLRWRGLVCGAAVALFLTPGFLEYLITVRTKALALEKSVAELSVKAVQSEQDVVGASILVIPVIVILLLIIIIILIICKLNYHQGCTIKTSFSPSSQPPFGIQCKES